MHKFAFLVLTVLSVNVYATDYEGAARKQALCQDMAEKIGESYFEMKKRNIAYDVSFLDPKNRVTPLMIKIADYAYHQATTPENAYTVGWGICMDHMAALTE